jgi:hypothetical protein
MSKDPNSPNMQVAGRMLSGGGRLSRKRHSRKMRGGFSDFLLGNTHNVALSTGNSSGGIVSANAITSRGNVDPSVFSQPVSDTKYTLV